MPKWSFLLLAHNQNQAGFPTLGLFSSYACPVFSGLGLKVQIPPTTDVFVVP